MRNETIDETINATIAKQYTDWHIKHGGFARDMTMRDYIASIAMQKCPLNTPAMDAEWCYARADAMLKERNK
jgi:hypothetical protein